MNTIAILIIRLGRKLVHFGHRQSYKAHTRREDSLGRQRLKIDKEKREQLKLQQGKINALAMALAKQQEIATSIEVGYDEKYNKVSAELGEQRRASNAALDEMHQVRRVLAA